MLSVKRNKSTQSTKFAQHIHITTRQPTKSKQKNKLVQSTLFLRHETPRETLLSDIPKEHPTSHWYFFGKHTSSYFLAIHLNLKASVYTKKI